MVFIEYKTWIVQHTLRPKCERVGLGAILYLTHSLPYLEQGQEVLGPPFACVLPTPNAPNPCSMPSAIQTGQKPAPCSVSCSMGN